MSFSFYITSKELPSPIDLLSVLNDEQIKAVENLTAESTWSEEGCFHYYIDQRSTRGVECGLADGMFQVRLMSCANLADHRLAERIIGIAAGSEGSIECESGDVLTATQLGTFFTEEWNESQFQSGPRVVAALVAKDAQVLTIPGALREAYFGPRTIAELQEGPPEQFHERFIERLRLVQYAGGERYFAASRMSATAPGSDERFTFAVVGPGVDYFIPKVERIAINAGPKDVVIIPRAELDALLPSPPRYLDDEQCIIESIDESGAWPGVVSRARPLAYRLPNQKDGNVTSGPPQQTNSPKKWWKLW